MHVRDVPKRAVRFLIRVYAYAVSPLAPGKCRFHPTCSAYASEAIDRHGVARGGVLAIRRLLKCHPWHRGPMIDPVP